MRDALDGATVVSVGVRSYGFGLIGCGWDGHGRQVLRRARMIGFGGVGDGILLDIAVADLGY